VSPSKPCIALVAGEASGDQLGAALIKQLKQRYPDATFTGIGGRDMRAAGMTTWWDSEELSVFGLFEVLSHFPRLYRIRRALRNRLLALKPDVFIGIDAPDFNLGL
jgi:lipid-A-disaccharide synthase